MKNLIIVQSTPGWGPLLEKAIKENLKGFFDGIQTTDSFDHAIDLISGVSQEDQLVIITSEDFHDSLSDHRKIVTQKTMDLVKSGNLLAKMAKEIHSMDTTVLIYSSYIPDTKEGKEFFNKHIFKEKGEHKKEILLILEFLKSIPTTESKSSLKGGKYHLMIYAAVTTLYFYRKDIIPIKEGEMYGVFMEKNKAVIDRVIQECISLFNYELSSHQIVTAVMGYCSESNTIVGTEPAKLENNKTSITC